ncbi:MAG: glycoside hydrolase family 16 protein [Bacteroidales bacterium]|nr:glycoside hydrolase family 16 protein [Bacteroidales bacterium]
MNPKSIVSFVLAILCFFSCKHSEPGWSLVWSDEFDGPEIDSMRWSRVGLGPSDWNNMMSLRKDLAYIEDGQLVLLGKINDRSSGDTTAFVTGGIESRGKVSFKLSRFEIKARFNSVNGFWPALWLMPDCSVPDNNYAEVDLMEHLNSDSFVYQTVHSRYSLSVNDSVPPHYSTAPIDASGWNIYAAEIYKDSLCLFTNGVKTLTYPKIDSLENQFPWADFPFYMILSNQLEGGWVGKVSDPSQLPSELRVDWVKVYEWKE